MRASEPSLFELNDILREARDINMEDISDDEWSDESGVEDHKFLLMQNVFIIYEKIKSFLENLVTSLFLHSGGGGGGGRT